MWQWPEGGQLDDGRGQVFSGAAVAQRVTELAARLRASGATHVALAGDNSPAWIMADLACEAAGCTAIPIPAFFTREQRLHAAQSAGFTHVFCNGDLMPAEALWPELKGRRTGVANHSDAQAILPAGAQKLTFTSGTTGQPKGIALSWTQQMQTAQSLRAALSSLNVRVHLNALPLAVLLENIAGVYAPLLMGARVVSPPLQSVGLQGSSAFDPVQCLRAIAAHRAESLILLPHMLLVLVTALERDPTLVTMLTHLKLVAIGGAPTAPSLLLKARAFGMPVYEGYGLTECASVCCLNTPDADAPGTVGLPLPGTNVGLADDGEIWVRGRGHLGGGDASGRIWTGDIGTWERHGDQHFLRIIGRKKNILITAFGRNVSPEWPEGLLMDSGLFAQAIVLGDGLPQLQAVLVPLRSDISTCAVADAVDAVNRELPDYARIGQWVLRSEPFTEANGLATANGRPLRARIAATVQCNIQSGSSDCLQEDACFSNN